MALQAQLGSSTAEPQLGIAAPVAVPAGQFQLQLDGKGRQPWHLVCCRNCVCTTLDLSSTCYVAHQSG